MNRSGSCNVNKVKTTVDQKRDDQLVNGFSRLVRKLSGIQDDRRLQLISENFLFSILPALIFAPYVIWAGIKYQNQWLLLIAACFIVFDLYMIYRRIKINRQGISEFDEPLTNLICGSIYGKCSSDQKKKVFATLYMLIPAYVLAPLLIYLGQRYQDWILILFGVGVFLVDNYHYRLTQ